MATTLVEFTDGGIPVDFSDSIQLKDGPPGESYVWASAIFYPMENEVYFDGVYDDEGNDCQDRIPLLGWHQLEATARHWAHELMERS